MEGVKYVEVLRDTVFKLRDIGYEVEQILIDESRLNKIRSDTNQEFYGVRGSYRNPEELFMGIPLVVVDKIDGIASFAVVTKAVRPVARAKKFCTYCGERLEE